MWFRRASVLTPRPRKSVVLAKWLFRAARWAVRRGVRHRGRLWPLYAAFALGVVCEVFSRVPDGWRTALSLCGLAGVVLGAWQYRVRPPRLLVAWTWGAWGVITAWMGFASAYGPLTRPIVGYGLVGAIAAEIALLWTTREQPQQPHIDIEGNIRYTNTNPILDEWMKYVSAPDKALPGSRLEQITDIPHGWSAYIAMPKGGTQTHQTAIGATGRISSVYGVPPTQVFVEPPLTGMTNEARIMVLDHDPLRRNQEFDGPTIDYDTGYVVIGKHADGADAHWRLFTPESGANHGMISGTTGAGKSGIVNTLCAEIRHSGIAVLWVADPQNGLSVPDWQTDGPHVFAGTLPKIRRMLQAFERIGIARQARRSVIEWVDEQGRTRTGLGSHTPTADDPMHILIIEESPDVLADSECARIVAKIGKTFRKLGMGVYLVNQVPSLSEMGGDLTIRSMASSTNILIFRTSDRLSGSMGIPADLPIDPASIPAAYPDGTSTAGLGYIPVAGGRVSPMRARRVMDPFHWATTGIPVTIPAEDVAAADDGQGNYVTDWRDLRHTPDIVDQGSVIHLATGDDASTNAKILAYLDKMGPSRTGTMAADLGIGLPAASNSLTRLAKEGRVEKVTHGLYALPGHGSAQAEVDKEEVK